MSDLVELRRHVAADHPGTDAPWWTGSGYVDVMPAAAVERLHAELHRQGDAHRDQWRGGELRPSVCRRAGCSRPAPRADGLCDLHGEQQDRLRGRRSA